jgi:glycosyltransferase involved in cell wall biosynthesis
LVKPGAVLVIGPLQQTAGGVATHIRNLQQLQAFAEATFYDPGSINTQQRQSIYSILLKLRQLRRLVEQGNFSKILINSSIFPFAFIKLLLTLRMLPRTGAAEIHVFFHGGRFTNSRLYAQRGIAGYYRRMLQRTTCCYFLSPLQKQQFEQRFPAVNSALYGNYATADEIVSKTFNDAEPLRLLFVGRVIAAKGVFELIAALEQLQHNPVTTVHLRIVGDGEDLAALRQRAGTLVDAGIVEFSGYLYGEDLVQV